MRLHFGDFCFDPERRELSERGRPVHLAPKAMDLLRLLLSQRPKIVPKQQIYTALWPDVYVEEANLSVHVAELRGALHDDSREPRLIRTVHRFGYGFIGEVREESAAESALVRVRAGRREFELLAGENIVGRDPDVRIRLNAPGISRRHARIVVAGDRLTIEDLGSKNGTFVQGQRIEGVHDLRDGDEIRLSRELLVIDRPVPAGSTITESD